MIGSLIVGGGIVVAALAAKKQVVAFLNKPAATRINSAQAKIENVVATESLKIESAILGELTTLQSVAGAAIRRVSTLTTTGAVKEEVAKALDEAYDHFENAINAVENAIDPKHFPRTMGALS